MALKSNVFDVQPIELAGTKETVVQGGRHLFPKLTDAFAGIKRIGVIGWGSQGPAQAQNLRDSLEGTDIEVVVGLREGSSSWAEAEAAGLKPGEMFSVIGSSDLVILLIADAAQAGLYKKVFEAIRPGATLGLSHGFLLAHMQSVGDEFPAGINVIAACPKGMGPSVRRLYEQGKDVDGAGINASVAIHQDIDGRATDIALGWAVAIGAPYIFETTLQNEVRSDVFGERGILLGALHGIVESLFRRFTELGDPPEKAFVRACESVTGPLAKLISHEGIKAVSESFEGDAKRTFEEAYSASYKASMPILLEIYDEVSSGNEIRSVIQAGERLKKYPMSEIGTTRMWKVGQTVRGKREETTVDLDPTTSGTVCGTMLAQIDVLRDQGHAWSEIANESVIEAVDSLIPYMHARGVGYMVDNCSTTARLGTRKWGPRFESAMNQEVFPVLDEEGARDDDLVTAFQNHPIHQVLDEISKTRPAVDISVT
jgi:ketol-acid reductoisomerase